MEVLMCHYRSYASDSAARAEAERQKELKARRDEVLGALLKETKPAAEAKPAPASTKEVAPAK
jgi:hypothetical protein